ncbi:MAG: uracil phosphoribosyltransferase [Peptococcaceae bacterium BICA1-7]|nr:MAG: uracil phosphoribosyltransferase [Peptococcaceae bacterium BICA1-7]
MEKQGGKKGLVRIVEHPLAGNFLRDLRNKDTQIEGFRKAMGKLGLLLAMEATKDLKTMEGTVVTPLEVEARCTYTQDGRVLLVPILRAGMGLVESFLELLPSARVAHVGMYRDHETLEARTYLDTVPSNTGGFDRVLVLDPMLATGNSSVKALEFVIAKGYSPQQITLVCAFSVRQGLDQVNKKFPDVSIVTAVIDPGLNEKSYIVPGLGDAGDRLYLI